MIKFPRMHIAASVQNRILNVRDEILADRAAAAAAAEIRPAPEVPDAQAEALGIDEALAGEVPAAGMPPFEPGADSAAAAGSILEGGTALEGLIKRRTQPQ